MLKENWRSIARIERVADFLLIVGVFFVTYYGRASLLYWNQRLGWHLQFGGERLAPLKDYFIVLVVALVGYLATLNILGAYGSMRLSSSWRILRLSVLSSLIVFMLLAATLFILKVDLSRSFVVMFCVLATLSITAERFLVLEFLRFWRRRGRNFRNIIIAGSGEQAVRMAIEIHGRPELGLRIFGFADLSTDTGGAKFAELRAALRRAGVQRIGRLIEGTRQLESVVRENPIDEVIFTDLTEVLPKVEEMVLLCAEQGIRSTIAADLFSIGLVKSGISYFGSMPLIHFQTPPGDRWELALKRSIDVMLSGLILLLIFPLLLIIWVSIRFGSRGPAIFSQTRVGLNGRHFTMYKFRSMRVDAEKELQTLLSQNEMQGPVFKLSDDPRITPIGRLMRRYSLDELPQLWNVFRGDMSLVGPRPPVPGEVSMYERKDRRRLSMRPGMTCIWQVSGRNEIRDFSSWVKLDLEYIDNWSLSLDFMLLFRTIPAVLFGHGAR
ncbi:MAG: sugar transferase [Oligoflexia bacterium]|nr:sugar transferase [Oligoflexia bacterium]